jgi:hypothetical protein
MRLPRKGSEFSLDGAVLDLKLGTERVYAAADTLLARGVPFIFATGYGRGVMPEKYAGVPRCEKPVDMTALMNVLSSRLTK